MQVVDTSAVRDTNYRAQIPKDSLAVDTIENTPFCVQSNANDNAPNYYSIPAERNCGSPINAKAADGLIVQKNNAEWHFFNYSLYHFKIRNSLLNTSVQISKAEQFNFTKFPQPSILVSILITFLFCVFIIWKDFRSDKVKLLLNYLTNFKSEKNALFSKPKMVWPHTPFFFLFGNFIIALTISNWLVSQYVLNTGLIACVLIGFVALTCGSILRNVVIRSVGNLFNVNALTSHHIFVSYLTLHFLAFLLLPSIFIMALNISAGYQTLFYLLSTAILLAYGYHIIRLILPLNAKNFIEFLHFILYLCALEIVPLLLFYRISKDLL